MGKLKKKIALIFGITGQDGSYLAEFLLKKNYIVYGVKRRSSSANTERIDHIFDSINFKNKNFSIFYGDLADGSNIFKLINALRPNEIYNLAAQSHVRVSFEVPEYTSDITGMGSLRILEAIRSLKLNTKFYQASSSEMFGKLDKKKSIDEKTPFHPRSMYGVAKVFSYHTTVHYREAYKIFACNGILFNHESPRRGPTFVTKKIVQGLVRIKKGIQKKIILGNIYSIRDWGHAKDYVESMWRILQYKKPDDWVIATNKESTVKNFISLACKNLDISIKWVGKGMKEKAINTQNNQIIIELDKKFLRPTEVDYLKGNYAKAKKLLKWKPRYEVRELVKDMILDELSKYN